ELGIGFCFAPLFHGAMKYAAPVRKQLGIRTIFNLLGPLTNPARAEFQLLGTSSVAIANRLARALVELGRSQAFVVCGADQLDEVSLWGRTTAFEIRGAQLIEHHWTAESFGLAECDVGPLQVDSPVASAQMVRQVFEGVAGPPRDIVVANAAAGLLAARQADELPQAVTMAAAAIDSGRVASLLQQLVAMTVAFRG
ncbi:MAG: anthranilate phosphoribosyltransferase, partial [Planctomycetes bacterium]|nr:anthranilate phosphoribosyltransferase [Planctomycetota bacterium]